MNKLFILLMLTVINSQAQTSQILWKENSTSSINRPVSVYLSERKDTDIKYVNAAGFNEKGRLQGYAFVSENKDISSLIGTNVTGYSGESNVTSFPKSPVSSVSLAGVSSTSFNSSDISKWIIDHSQINTANFKPDYSNYNVKPDGKTDLFYEFHRSEVLTFSGEKVNLNTTYFPITFDNTIPTSLINGSTTIVTAAYQSKIAGSGDQAYYQLTAPTKASGVSLDLFTAANLTNSTSGTIKINIPGSYSFGMGVEDNVGYLGWLSSSDAARKLHIVSNEVVVSGSFFSNDVITSGKGVNVFTGDYSAKMNTSSLVFNTSTGYSYVGVSYRDLTRSNAMLIESTLPSGILFNVNQFGIYDHAAVTIAIDHKPITSFNRYGMSLGNVSADPEVAFAIGRGIGGLKYPNITDEEMWAKKNPTEGVVWYNTDRHRMVYFDGTEWVEEQAKKSKRLKTKLDTEMIEQ